MGTLPLDDPARELLRIALEEDLGEEGDITSAFFVPLDLRKKARIFGKEEGITLSGVSLAAEVFAMVDPELVVSCEAQEGETIAREQSVLTVEGKVQSILTAERTALNFLQRLSGVASLTRKYVLAAGSRVQVLDTRKTTPGWRRLEKDAVGHGGGVNHRFGLHDAFLVKDNHLLAAASLDQLGPALQEARRQHPEKKLQMEVDTLDQLKTLLRYPEIDGFLLDNMSLKELREGVAMRDSCRAGEVFLEASGGVNLDTIGAIGETGVDFISVGALTHSAVAVDLSLELLD